MSTNTRRTVRPPTVYLVEDAATQPDPEAPLPAEPAAGPAPAAFPGLGTVALWVLAWLGVASAVALAGGVEPGWWQ